jgi:hypothetical protein
LALATLDGAHWSALAPTAALRRWRLIDVQPRAGVTGALLRIDERILHFLAGITYVDPRIRGIVEPVEGVAELPASQADAAQTIMASWLGTQALGAKPVVVLQGRDPVIHEAAVAAAWDYIE